MENPKSLSCYHSKDKQADQLTRYSSEEKHIDKTRRFDFKFMDFGTNALISLHDSSKTRTSDASSSTIIKNYITGKNIAELKKSFGERSVNLIEFVEIILSHTESPGEDVTYLVSGLKKLFENISYENEDTQSITFKAFLNFIMNELSNNKTDNTGLKFYRAFSKDIFKDNIDKLAVLNTHDVKIYQEK